MIAFVYYFSALGAIIAGSMVFPALIAFGSDEAVLGYRILLYSGSVGFVCIATFLAVMGRLKGIRRNTAILLAVFSWIAFPVITAVPIADMGGLTYTDALFQTVSSFTTSGSSAFQNLETVPSSILFMLAQFQWLGGLATLITLILVLAPWEIGGLPQVSTASVAASIVASHDRLVSFCAGILRVYLLMTLACFIFLVLANISPFKAMIFAFTALSTGGIVPATQSLDLELGNAGMLVMGVFFILGATSIFWHQYIYRLQMMELKSHRESYFIVAVWIGLAFFIAYTLSAAAGATTRLPDFTALSEGFFNSASILSTSGLQSRPGAFTLLPPILVLIVVFIGGGCYSTSGGIKFFRIGGMYSLAQYELNRLIYPHATRPSMFGDTRLNIDFMKAVWSLFSILIITVAIASCALSLTGMNFHASFTAVIAAISNAGPLYGPEWGTGGSEPWPSYADMIMSQKLIISVVMILGRLEVIAVVASISVLISEIRDKAAR